jgi:hypothetical protein
VAAFVDEHASGTGTATFNLVVANTGNRPATHVRLHASRADLLTLLEGEATPDRVRMIEQTFLKESAIPVLLNGENLTTSFGAFTNPKMGNGSWLNYGAQIDVSLSYQDLDGRFYRSRQPLKIYARKGFGGGTWSD